MRDPRALLVLTVTAVLAAAAGCTNDDGPSAAPVASPSTPVATLDAGGAAGGTMPAIAFPLTSVLAAADQSLPADVTIGEIPRDTRWLPGNRMEVPISRDGTDAVLTVTVLPARESCAARSQVLTPAEAEQVASRVCDVWVSEGRLPVVVPDPDAPIETDPSDAAR
jgi:hypothetical protein